MSSSIISMSESSSEELSLTIAREICGLFPVPGFVGLTEGGCDCEVCSNSMTLIAELFVRVDELVDGLLVRIESKVRFGSPDRFAGLF